jgi:predicted permease
VDDLAEEIRAHLEMEEQENLESGMPPDEAHYAALRRFGNVTLAQERSREMWRWNSVETLLQDLRYGLRMLRKNPGFTAVAVLTLALGIGANTAIFSLIDTVMLRMLPVEKAEELFQVQWSDPDGGGGESSSFTNPMWEQVRDHQDVFSGAFAWSNKDEFDLTQGGMMHPANGVWVSGSFFSTLGLRPAAGRLITDSDDQRGCPAVAVLSYGFWQGHYGGAKIAIGSTLSLRSRAFEVIGVTPPGFYGMEVGERFDVALPICATAVFDGKEPRLDNGSFLWLNVAGRINPKMRRAELAARLRILSPRVFIPQNASPEERQALAKIALAVVPAATGISGLRHQFSQPLQILMAVVGLVLLIACANVASLTLARAAARHQEIAVRRALGASRTGLIRQLLTECVLLSSAGALLGILFARWGAALLVRIISTTQNVVFLDLSLNSRILGFVLAIAVLTALLFGLLPALRSTRVSLSSAMKGSQSPEAGRSLHFHGRKWIVGSQVALSLVLLVAAGLLLRSFVKLATLDIGFDRNSVLLVNVNLKTAKVPPDRQAATYDEIGSRLGALPGVLSIGRSTFTPISGVESVNTSVHTQWTTSRSLETGSGGWSEDETSFLVYSNYISPGYLPTLRMRLLAGRNLTSADMGSSHAVAIVNQTFARRFFPGLNPIGRTYLEGLPAQPFEVVGVIEDSKNVSLREETRPTVFLPVNAAPGFINEEETFALRTAIPPSGLTSPVRAAVAGVSSAIPLDFHTLAEQVNDSVVQERMLALLSGFFGALALLLAMIGLYGTFSYLVTQRQKEFGVRMALGAEPRSILRLVMLDLVVVLAGGLVAGSCISLATTRVLQGMLFGLGPRDTGTLFAAAGLLTAVALVAGYLPAHRATKVDPMVALRHE